MLFRSLAKKHLYAIEGETLPPSGTDIEKNGTVIGIMRSHCGTAGLALLKDEALPDIAPYKIIC